MQNTFVFCFFFYGKGGGGGKAVGLCLKRVELYMCFRGGRIVYVWCEGECCMCVLGLRRCVCVLQRGLLDECVKEVKGVVCVCWKGSDCMYVCVCVGEEFFVRVCLGGEGLYVLCRVGKVKDVVCVSLEVGGVVFVLVRGRLYLCCLRGEGC